MNGAKHIAIWGLLAMSMIQTAQGEFDEPPEQALPSEDAELPFFVQDESAGPAQNSRAAEVRRKHEGRLFKIDGVEGVSIESGEIGEDIIVVFVRDESVVRKIPKTLDGVPVRTEVSGEFDAFLHEEDIEGLEPASPAPKKQPKARNSTTRKAVTTKAKTTTQAKRGPAALLEVAGRAAKPSKSNNPAAPKARPGAAAKSRKTTARKPKS